MPGNPLSDELLDGMHTLAEMTSDVHVSVTKDAFLAMSTELRERRKAAELARAACQAILDAIAAEGHGVPLDLRAAQKKADIALRSLTPNKDTTS